MKLELRPHQSKAIEMLSWSSILRKTRRSNVQRTDRQRTWLRRHQRIDTGLAEGERQHFFLAEQPRKDANLVRTGRRRFLN
jgi:hypothetical protein